VSTSSTRRTGAEANAVRRAGRDAGAVADRAAESRAIDVMARWGLAARGAIYLVVALLALDVAMGRRGQQPTGQGALLAVAHEPLGTVLLALLASGLGAQACWRIARAVAPQLAGRDEPHGLGTRLADAGRALLYGGLAIVAVELLLGQTPSAANSDKLEQDWTGRVLHWPGGRVLVVAVGAAIVIGGAVVAWRGITGRFGRDLRMPDASPRVRAIVVTLAKIGITARSVVAALVGAFLIAAAITYDPAESTGIDGALERVRHHAYGTVLLVLVAAGLAAYGLYSFAEARYGELPRR
jgi:uncharacterized protein DUF1206